MDSGRRGCPFLRAACHRASRHDPPPLSAPRTPPLESSQSKLVIVQVHLCGNSVNTALAYFKLSKFYSAETSLTAEIDFGGLPYAIYLEEGSSLAFTNVNLTGGPVPTAYLNSSHGSTYGKYAAQGLAQFPSINAAPGSQVLYPPQHARYLA